VPPGVGAYGQNACPGSISSSPTLTICPGRPGSGPQALVWKVLCEREGKIVIGTDENALAGMCFMPVTDSKTVKNRLHLGLTSSTQDREQKIERLLALRARWGRQRADWRRVLAGAGRPRGNEFCREDGR
jgi:hypothetical protein